MNRVTPEDIKEIAKGDLFVFGSNESGIHGAGAAKFALNYCGARPGMGFGLSGRSFAIPTKDWMINVLPLSAVQAYVDRFVAWVETMVPKDSEAKIYVTRIGCGLAGFTPKDIAPMFTGLRNHKNVYLPEDFIDVIDSKMIGYDAGRTGKA